MADGPYLEFPDAVELSLDEVAVILNALDLAAEAVGEGTNAHQEVRRATRLITEKLWPELGEMLRDEE